MTPTFLKKWMNSSNFTDSEKADLSAYSTDEPDSSTAIEELIGWVGARLIQILLESPLLVKGRFIRLGSILRGVRPGRRWIFRPNLFLNRPNVVLDLNLHQRWTRRDLNVFRESKSKSLLASSSFSCE